MKRQKGSALLLVFLLIAGITILLVRLHYRASLLLQTVIEREQQIKWHYATESLMLYAISLAKQNWRAIGKKAKQAPLTYTDISWPIDEHKKANGTIIFKKQKEKIIIQTELGEHNHSKEVKISCTIAPCVAYEHAPETIERVVIQDWSIQA